MKLIFFPITQYLPHSIAKGPNQGADPRSGSNKIPFLCSIILAIQSSFCENGGLQKTNPFQIAFSPSRLRPIHRFIIPIIVFSPAHGSKSIGPSERQIYSGVCKLSFFILFPRFTVNSTRYVPLFTIGTEVHPLRLLRYMATSLHVLQHSLSLLPSVTCFSCYT